METAAIVLGLAALGGAVLAAIRLSGRPFPPLWLALGHGAIAATGVGILGYTVFTQTVPWLAQVSLGMFLLAAVGGLGLFLGFHMRNQPLPIPFVLGHGALAAASLIVLLIAIYG
jgi:hypothetical protein